MMHLVLGLIACVITVKSFAWSDPIHIVIAKIARSNLNPGVLGRIEDLANNIEGAFPLTFDFVNASCWANDISRGGCGVFDSWHEQPMPYDPENILADSKQKAIRSKIDQNSNVFALVSAMTTLRNPQAGQWEKNFCLRILMHCLADLHNPMACISLYSSDFPDGDQGGRLFRIESVYGSLRELWDHALLFSFPQEEIREWTHDLTYEQQEELDEVVEKILSIYPRFAFSDLREGSFADWAKSSYGLAVHHAYQGILPGDYPTNEYLQKSRQIALEQIAKAGYRLADKLNEIFQQ